ncbi:hypothetical protein [Sediminibacterium sp.]|uniref:hypothetical protein n=1 Tax=Sediminibacterium sp. TaxID=1917865 RepID=UPI002733045B|nr:hypothetical protein [Sediminibacterium sp.]
MTINQRTGVSTFASRTSPSTVQSLQKSLHLTDPKEEFQKFYPTLIKKIKTHKPTHGQKHDKET